ncbi:MAG: hypothetical protein U0996_25480 [Planctomycetaceae bacterium]
MTSWPDQLYKLLPAVHQIRDAENGEALRAFLQIIGEQTQQIHEDIERLYDNWFIETSDDWVVPYLGDLVGFRRSGAAGEPADAITPRGQLLNRFLYPRREIANLVRRRRRKGTLSVLEDMAHDASGWSARAVESSRLISFFQNVKHPQPNMGRTFSVREKDTHRQVNTPFDKVAHTVDVRAIQSLPGVGWYHPKKVGLFVWRRKIFSATMVCPCRTCCKPQDAGKEVPYYTFHRAGISAPLYVRPVRETDELHIAEEANLPVPLYRHLLADEHGHASDAFYGLGGAEPKSLAIYTRKAGTQDWTLVPGDQVVVADLTEEAMSKLSSELSCDCVAVDPERGLLLRSCKAEQCEIRVSYHYAATAEMGGGEYEREVMRKPDATVVRVRSEDCCNGGVIPSLLDEVWTQLESMAVLRSANANCRAVSSESVLKLNGDDVTSQPCTDPRVAHWIVQEDLCVEISESDTFQIPAKETLRIADGKTLIIRAARGAWPHLLLSRSDFQNSCPDPWRIQMGSGSILVLDGLLINGVTMQLESIPDSEEKKDQQRQIVSHGCGPCGDSGTDHSVAPSLEAAQLHVRHSTFVPGGKIGGCGSHASISMKVKLGHVDLRHSIAGTMNIEHAGCMNCCSTDSAKLAKNKLCPLDPVSLSISDSIVETAHGLCAIYSNCCNPAHVDLRIQRSTVFGNVCVQQISSAEDSLFTGIVHVQRRGHGYMRFCYVPTAEDLTRNLSVGRMVEFEAARKLLNSLNAAYDRKIGATLSNSTDADSCQVIRTPPRFKCLPEPTTKDTTCSTGCGQTTAVNNPKVDGPGFVSQSYGQPGYGELALDCDEHILGGSEDQSELGAFHDLFRPQRDAALRSRLQEYTPADMQSAILYADDLHLADFGRFRSSTQH